MTFTEEDKVRLESIIDTFGLFTVLEATADICIEKATHIMTNWQDRTTAEVWDKAGSAIQTFNAKKISKLGL